MVMMCAGLQALLQYASQSSAVQARSTLQGRNIYDGCCTLDIQYSNLQELQVNYNNERTRDFTNAALPSEQSRPGNPGNNIMSSLFGEGGHVYSMGAGGPRPGGFQQSGGHPALGMNSYGQVAMGGASAAAAAFGGVLPPGITGTNDRSTLLVSNLVPEKIDADRLFNLFSNYGNIVRIKILHNKPDHALIQMGDGFQAELAFNYLKGVTLFGKRMDVNFSKHAQINPSPDTSDFSSSPLNRFNRNAAKNYRYCCAPTKMIHVSSLPADIALEDITSHLSAHGTVANAKVFESNGKKQALMLFESEEQATEALVCKHASQLQSNTIRLAFSKLASV
uniref:RRM domain-containing protein n=1 Tax=Physcomitrium patens TaxID=3218 RepID=A0A7I4AQW7_PHYPA